MYKCGDLALTNSYTIHSFCLSSSAYQDREENMREKKNEKAYDKDILITEGKTNQIPKQNK